MLQYIGKYVANSGDLHIAWFLDGRTSTCLRMVSSRDCLSGTKIKLILYTFGRKQRST